jgi:hypothetical protein
MGKSATHWPALCFLMGWGCVQGRVSLTLSSQVRHTGPWIVAMPAHRTGTQRVSHQRPFRTSEMRNSVTWSALSMLPTKDPSV